MFTFTSSSPVDKWSPALQIRTVLLSIQALLSAPNPDDPLANDVAEQWKSNEAQAIETGQICGTGWAFYFAFHVLFGRKVDECHNLFTLAHIIIMIPILESCQCFAIPVLITVLVIFYW